MRPRNPRTSEEAPTTAIDFGHSIFPISGMARLPETQSARDDAAQDFSRTALYCQLGCNSRREGKLLLERRTVANFGRKKRSKFSLAVRHFLLPNWAKILHDGAFDHRPFASLQHTRHRNRHTP